MKIYDSNDRLYIEHNDRMCMVYVNERYGMMLAPVQSKTNFAGWKEEDLVYEQLTMEVGGVYKLKDIKPNNKMVILDSAGIAFQYYEKYEEWQNGRGPGAMPMYEEETVTIIHMGGETDLIIAT